MHQSKAWTKYLWLNMTKKSWSFFLSEIWLVEKNDVISSFLVVQFNHSSTAQLSTGTCTWGQAGITVIVWGRGLGVSSIRLLIFIALGLGQFVTMLQKLGKDILLRVWHFRKMKKWEIKINTKRYNNRSEDRKKMEVSFATSTYHVPYYSNSYLTTLCWTHIEW